MGTTMSMILGLAFVVLGITAVMLQSWLWGFPMDGDKSTAPRLWTNIHRVVGLSFVVIYVIMMYFMFPRLWTYQVELPARTVVHAVLCFAQRLAGTKTPCKEAIERSPVTINSRDRNTTTIQACTRGSPGTAASITSAAVTRILSASGSSILPRIDSAR